MEFVDSGRDLILAADESASDLIHEIATECGVDFDEVNFLWHLYYAFQIFNLVSLWKSLQDVLDPLLANIGCLTNESFIDTIAAFLIFLHYRIHQQWLLIIQAMQFQIQREIIH